MIVIRLLSSGNDSSFNFTDGYDMHQRSTVMYDALYAWCTEPHHQHNSHCAMTCDLPPTGHRILAI